MNDDLDLLYQEVILDHAANPRHYGRLAAADRQADGHNPLCGDAIALWLAFEGERIAALGWEGEGCSISRASASLLAESVFGCDRADALARIDEFRGFMKSNDAPAEGLADVAALAGVRRFPVRIRCALLAWTTLKTILDDPPPAPLR